MSPGLNQAMSEEPETEHKSTVLDAPEFPDFDHSETETAGGEAVDIAALELEALDLLGTGLPVPDQCEVTDSGDPQHTMSFCEPVKPLISTNRQDQNLGSEKTLIPLDPANLQEPVNISEFPEAVVSQLWSQSEEVGTDRQFNSHADEADLGPAGFQYSAQHTDDCNEAVLNDGIQSHPR